MVALALPTTTAPGEYQQESGGRIKNAYVEPLAGNAGTKFALKRCAGLTAFGTTEEEGFRSSQLVGANLYSAWSGKVVSHDDEGGAGTTLTGSLLGTLPVIWARNNASTPDLVAVAPGDGAFEVSTTAVVAYTDSDVGSPNSVCTINESFIFTQEDGRVIASDPGSTVINALNYAYVQSRPGALYRGIPLGNGQALFCKSSCMEVWGGVNDTGFPLSYIQTIPLGIFGRYCVAGDADGWSRERVLVGNDGGVYKLVGYQPQKISDPDLDRLIKAVEDPDDLQLFVYVSNGRPFVVVQCEEWCWECDLSQTIWHERNSYQELTWRGLFPVLAFGQWIAGDRLDSALLSIDQSSHYEVDQPLVFEVETGPQGSFPNGARVNRLDLYMSVGVGIASGTDPIVTDPSISIWMSKDNGLTWGNAWVRKIGAQGKALTKVTVNNLGHCGPQGVKFKFQISDPVHVGLMGGDIDVTLLGK